jgi:hypothetical protein
MNEEQFLARWSRRKQEAKAGHAETASEGAFEAHGSVSADRVAAEPLRSETELSNLPPIESIDAVTDVTAFLRKGIPQELTRAALRRAWIADPAIRDFVGLAENAWDFNDPNAMAGFGPLGYSAEQVDTLVRRIVGGVVRTAGSLPDPVAKAADEGARSADGQIGFASDPVRVTLDPRSADESTAAKLPPSSAASQPAAPSEETSFLRRRTHGGALPR